MDGVTIDEEEFTRQNRSNRDENNLSLSVKQDRKFSAASVDVLIGECTLFFEPFTLNLTPNVLDGLELKREKEIQQKKEKKKKVYTDQEEIHSQRKLQEQLQNIEPPNCGPKRCNVSIEKLF